MGKLLFDWDYSSYPGAEKYPHIFKPVDRAPYYKLSTKGAKWIEEEVLPPLKKK